MKTEKRPYSSGWCAIGNPTSTHARCPVDVLGRHCTCPCHTRPEVEPQVWEGDCA